MKFTAMEPAGPGRRNVVGIIATLVYGEDETAGGPDARPRSADRHHRWLLQRAERSQSAEGQNVEGNTASTTWASIGSTVLCTMPAAQRTSQRPTCERRLMEATLASAPRAST